MRRFLIALLGVTLSAAVAAQEPTDLQWKIDGAPAAPDPAHASKNGFGAVMVVTSDHDGFWRAWEGPTPPHITTTSEVRRDQPVHAMVLFSGCRAAADGNCDVTIEATVTGPGGKPYGDTFKVKAWGGPPAPQYNLQASHANLAFVLEAQDELGTYTVKAIVTDQVAGTSVAVQELIQAVASK